MGRIRCDWRILLAALGALCFSVVCLPVMVTVGIGADFSHGAERLSGVSLYFMGVVASFPVVLGIYVLCLARRAGRWQVGALVAWLAIALPVLCMGLGLFALLAA